MGLPAPGRDACDHLLRLDSPILVSNVSEVNPRRTATSLLTPQPPPRRWAPRRYILTHAAAPTATSTRGPEPSAYKPRLVWGCTWAEDDVCGVLTQAHDGFSITGIIHRPEKINNATEKQTRDGSFSGATRRGCHAAVTTFCKHHSPARTCLQEACRLQLRHHGRQVGGDLLVFQLLQLNPAALALKESYVQLLTTLCNGEK